MKRQKIKQNFQKKSLHLLYGLLIGIETATPSALARKLHVPRQVLEYHLKRLLKLGYLERYGLHNYRPTQSGLQFTHLCKTSSLPVTGKQARVHNLVLKFPILQDNPNATWQDHSDMKNWIKHYDRVDFPIGITIEKTPQSVIADFHSFETSQPMFQREFINHVMKGIFYLNYYLHTKKGIVIDQLHAETIRLHVANQMPDLDKKLDKRFSASVYFPRKAEGIFPSNQQASAWMDRSMGHVEVETNCQTYEETLLAIPEMLRQTTQAVTQMTSPILEFSRQIKLHLKVQRETLKALKEMRILMAEGGLRGSKRSKNGKS